jgi:hypothetical protein
MSGGSLIDGHLPHASQAAGVVGAPVERCGRLSSRADRPGQVDHKARHILATRQRNRRAHDEAVDSPENGLRGVK